MPAQGETHGVGNVSISMMPCPSRYRSGTAGAPKRQEGGTFTMTFADDGALGQGLLVPCRANFLDAAAVVVEAQELWRPEKRGAAGCSISGAWGCVGLVFRDQPVPAPWLRTWAEHFHRNACPVPPVDADGLLGIPWPVMPACSPVSDVRVLLATATKADATKALPMATRLLFCAQSSYWVIRLPSPGAIRCQGAKSGTVVPLFCGTPVKPSVGQAIVLCGLPTQTTPGGTVLRVNVRT